MARVIGNICHDPVPREKALSIRHRCSCWYRYVHVLYWRRYLCLMHLRMYRCTPIFVSYAYANIQVHTQQIISFITAPLLQIDPSEFWQGIITRHWYYTNLTLNSLCTPIFVSYAFANIQVHTETNNQFHDIPLIQETNNQFHDSPLINYYMFFIL